MDGFYLIQRLRDHEIRGDHSPSVAVALTGHTDDAYRLRSIGEGFQHFMTKPALPEDLVTLLHDAIDARAAGLILKRRRLPMRLSAQPRRLRRQMRLQRR